ncbi:MAG: PilZ domain-containing protein [Bryobacteraceae bacterium]
MRTATPPTTPDSESALGTAPTHDRRVNIRYPLALGLKYVLTRGRRAAQGQGFTVNLSRGGVLFESPDPLPVGLRVELRIAWPVSLNGLKGLNLWAQGRTVRTEGQCTAVQILHYEFRVRGDPQHEHSRTK